MKKNDHQLSLFGASERQSNPKYVRQSVRFPRDSFTVSQARTWMRKHGIKPCKPVDKTTNQLRYRLREPDDFQEDSFVTLEIANGVQFVSGYLKPGQREANPSELDFADQVAIELWFPKSRYTPNKALDWAATRRMIPIDVERKTDYYRLIFAKREDMKEAPTGELILVSGIKVIFGEPKRKGNPIGIVNVAQLIAAGAGAAKALGTLMV